MNNHCEYIYIYIYIRCPSRLQVIILARVLAHLATTAVTAAMLLILVAVAVTATMLLLLVFLLISAAVMDFDEFWDWFGAFNCWLWLPDWCWFVAVETVQFAQDVWDWCGLLAIIVICEFVMLISYLKMWMVVFDNAWVQTLPLTYIAFNGYWLYD